MTDKALRLIKGPVPFFAVLALASAAAAGEGGYRFREFPDDPPRAGEKAPMFAAADPDGKPVDMAALVGPAHLVLVFGAWT
ncbi:MAG: hypothetical protein MUC63_00090 [Planctomycetes bacterium]|nr:hypothetical protein [Planctomycetota bacterium]